MGYANYGFNQRLRKGIIDSVKLDGELIAGNWTMRGGLSGEWLKVLTRSCSLLHILY
jgi:hypothetical protein